VSFRGLFQASYDDRFERGLIRSSSGKFRILRRTRMLILEWAQISEMNSPNVVLLVTRKVRLCLVWLDVYSIKEATKPALGSPL
jgi:hypothetical protein